MQNLNAAAMQIPRSCHSFLSFEDSMSEQTLEESNAKRPVPNAHTRIRLRDLYLQPESCDFTDPVFFQILSAKQVQSQLV